jgi:transketolase
MALYACVAEKGWIEPGELEKYFENGSRLRGLSEADIPGVEVTSGSLGHGLSVGVGLALAAKRLGTGQMCYAIIGDGEANEGAIWEAIMFAAHSQLDNLVIIVDQNGFQAMGKTSDVMDMREMAGRLAAFDCEAAEVDGHDEAALHSTLQSLVSSKNGRPKCLVARTVKGKGVTFMEHENSWHYTRLDATTYAAALRDLERFSV